MFCVSKGGIIRMSRGDSVEFPVTIYDGTSVNRVKYDLAAEDELYFGLMEPNMRFEDALIRKKCDYRYTNEEGDIMIYLDPQDTEYLLPGLYYYQIKVRIYDPYRDDYMVNTILPKTQFWIEE